MKLIIFSILILFTITTINCFQYKDCGSKIGKFTKIVVTECDTTQNECILRRNSTVSIIITFVLSERVETATAVVAGKLLGAEIPFPLQHPDACDEDNGLKCPLEKDKTYEYRAALDVLQQYPKVKVEVKWELKDQNKNNIVCILIPAKIQ